MPTAYCAILGKYLYSVKSSCRFCTHQSQLFWPVLERIHFYAQLWSVSNFRSFSRSSLFLFFKWYFVSWLENTGENYTEHSSAQNSNLLILKVIKLNWGWQATSQSVLLKLNSNCWLDDELHLYLTAFPKQSFTKAMFFLSPSSEKSSATRTPKIVSMLYYNLKYLALKRKPTVI